MFDLQNSLTREKFSGQVHDLVKKGNSYLDSIMHLMNEHEIHEKEIPRLLDMEIKRRLEEESRDKRLLVEEDEEEDAPEV